ncbi:MAG: alpha/beta hydrolase [Spirochaetia bacterium]|nr:alpha/beta hydrolase [Spirochaetia bacterium]
MNRNNPVVKNIHVGFLLVGLLFFVLNGCSYRPAYEPVDLAGQVEVKKENEFILFTPKNLAPGKWALMFYPGGLVEMDAYTPIVTQIASRGYPCILIKMPFDLAVFDAQVGKNFFPIYPDHHWIVGGHSLGGAMAGGLAKQETSRVKALFLLAAYPGEADTLASAKLPVLSISASQDGLATPAKIEANKKFLPSDTKYVVIEGGNHSQFESYGAQNGDGTATISRSAQHNRVADEINAFLRSQP